MFQDFCLKHSQMPVVAISGTTMMVWAISKSGHFMEKGSADINQHHPLHNHTQNKNL